MNLIKKSLYLYFAIPSLLMTLGCHCIGKGYSFMKLIPLTQGKFAQVDDEDFEKLNQYKWYADKKVTKNTEPVYYARRHYTLEDGTVKSIYMHRQILNPDKNEIIDHADYNGLNNQRINLRKSDKRLNAAHQRKQPQFSSKFIGVSKYIPCRGKPIPKWKAQGQTNKGKRKHIGYFPYTLQGEIMAAKAFDEFAKEYYGEFATLNFPNEI